jgi:hypothetical protein
LFVGVVTLVTHFEPSVWQGTTWLIYCEAFAFVVFGVAWLVKGQQGLVPFLRDTQQPPEPIPPLRAAGPGDDA